MLKTAKEFDFVYKNSYKFRSESLDICVLRANMAGQFYEKFRRLPCNLVGFSVSKKVGNAVERNLIKRRLRTICREFFGRGNSSLELYSADFGIFGASQTPSLVLSTKFPPNIKLPPQILELNSTKRDLNESSLRGRIADSHEASVRSTDPHLQIQKNQIDCHDSANADSCNDKTKHNSTQGVDSRNDGVRQNIICIFIAKGQILQTPFIALKSTIFATLKRQLNFKKNSHFAPKMANYRESPKRESIKMSNRPKSHTQGLMQNENR